MVSDPPSSRALAPGAFPRTHWNLVLAARNPADPEGQAALETLCRAYWAPVYRFLRRDGCSSTDAQDLTQAFFERLIAKDYLQHLHHQQGRFRSFLLTFVRHFLSDERDRAQALKRGGGREIVSLEAFADEDQRPWEPSDPTTPEREYERRWAQAVLERAVARLRDEYDAAGRLEWFEALKDLHPGERGPESYATLAHRLHTTENAVKSAVHRLRQRHRECLRQEVAQTVRHPADVDAEIRELLAILGS